MAEKEELRPVDADHFWIGEVMVDLVQIHYEANRLGPRLSDGQEHSMQFNLQCLRHAAKCINTGDMKFITPEWVPSVLKTLNRLGLHTGYREEKEQQ